MKKVRNYLSQTEAFMAGEFLKAHGITAEVYGAKEYASYISGKDLGAYNLFVEEASLAQATELLKEIDSAPLDAPTPTEAIVYFKKSVISALLAIFFVPVICNILSIKNLILYRQAEKNPAKRASSTLLVTLLQLPSMITLYFWLETVPGITNKFLSWIEQIGK
ncbi:MAG: hypothetical protein AB7F59_00810 [Bdellovibrionales bacterium]